MTSSRERWLRIGSAGGWLVFSGLVMPVSSSEPRSLPIVVFWLFPVVLPFWFAAFAALSLRAVSDSGSPRGWALLHTLITVMGAAMLPVWLHLSVAFGHADHELLYRFSMIAYLALLPAGLPLLSRRNPTWRLLRALWLNAAGCLLFAISFVVITLHDGDASPFVAVPLAGLATLLIAALALERQVPKHLVNSLYAPQHELPDARLVQS